MQQNSATLIHELNTMKGTMVSSLKKIAQPNKTVQWATLRNSSTILISKKKFLVISFFKLASVKKRVVNISRLKGIPLISIVCFVFPKMKVALVLRWWRLRFEINLVLFSRFRASLVFFSRARNSHHRVRIAQFGSFTGRKKKKILCSQLTRVKAVGRQIGLTVEPFCATYGYIFIFIFMFTYSCPLIPLQIGLSWNKISATFITDLWSLLFGYYLWDSSISSTSPFFSVYQT